MPSLRAMQCLVAVAQLPSVTAAAKELGITQPALSHQLTSLERELGLPLFNRTQRGTRLTAAARALLPLAQDCVIAERALVARAQRVAGLHAGELRVCCAQSVTTGILPGVLRRWHQRHRDVTVFLTEYASADLVAEAVLAGDADLGVAPMPSSWAGTVTVLGWEQIVVAMAADDPLAAKRSVSLALLADRPLVHYSTEHALSGWVDALFAASGLRARAAVRTGQSTAAAVLAATGIGPALVPLSALPPRYPGAVRPLAPKKGRDIVALTTTSDPLADAFIRDLALLGVPQLARP